MLRRRNILTNLGKIGLEVIKRRIHFFLRQPIGLNPGPTRLPVAGRHLRLQFYQTQPFIRIISNGVNLARLALILRNQACRTLLWHRNEMFVKRFLVDVRKVNIVKLHAANFLQLFFHPPAHLQRKRQNLGNVVLRELTIWIQQLHHPRHCLAYRNRIPLVQLITQGEVLVESIAVRNLP